MEQITGFLGCSDAGGRHKASTQREVFLDQTNDANLEAFPEDLLKDDNESNQPQQRLGSIRAFSHLHEKLNVGDHLLVFVQGFNVTWWEAVASAASLQYVMNRYCAKTESSDPPKLRACRIVHVVVRRSDNSLLFLLPRPQRRHIRFRPSMARASAIYHNRHAISPCPLPTTPREIRNTDRLRWHGAGWSADLLDRVHQVDCSSGRVHISSEATPQTDEG